MPVKKSASSKITHTEVFVGNAYNPPMKIKFKSDSSVVEFQRIQIMDKRSKDGRRIDRKPPYFWYKYISIPQRHPTTINPKIGKELPLREEDIKYLIRQDLITYEH